jgi:hypothetical protein
MKNYENLKNILAGMEPDIIKFYEKGNHAAGTRIRKQLQDLKRAANDMRNEIQDIKKGGNS